MNEKSFSIDDLFREPEHWERAEALVSEIKELKKKYPDCRVSAENSTQAADKGYPGLIKIVRERGDELLAEKLAREMEALDILSATQTGIRVEVIANSTRSYRAILEDIHQLFKSAGAVKEKGGIEIIPSDVPETYDLPFDASKNYVYLELFYTCKERANDQSNPL